MYLFVKQIFLIIFKYTFSSENLFSLVCRGKKILQIACRRLKKFARHCLKRKLILTAIKLHLWKITVKQAFKKPPMLFLRKITLNPILTPYGKNFEKSLLI